MNVLVTGASGFIGTNLIVTLKKLENITVIPVTRDNPISESLVSKADFIFHLAGINRPKSDIEFVTGNDKLTKTICNLVLAQNRNIPIVFTSSIHSDNDTTYGKSKKSAEVHLEELYKNSNNPVHIYRLPNVFGKWCKPNYNSVVSTFCHNIANDLPISIDNPDTKLSLVHIGAVVTEFIRVLFDKQECGLYLDVKPVYKVRLGEIADLLSGYKRSRETIVTEAVGEGFERLLYATYLSYFPIEKFNYSVKKNEDPRGVFVEMLKTKNSGQFSYFTAHPGVTRGGHYHNVKTEKFLVIKGTAKFGFRHIVTNEYSELETNGDSPEIVETIPGWSHDITNIGDCELIVMLWANENFNPEAPDTVFHEV
jgi:UDP-2-acetamido-2,6-beta-L-arabino-hexul-4-ose reductase